MKELLLSKSFSEEICYLMPCGNVESLDNTILNLLPNEMTIYLNMLCSFMVHGICSNVQSCFAVIIQESKLHIIHPKGLEQSNKPQIH